MKKSLMFLLFLMVMSLSGITNAYVTEYLPGGYDSDGWTTVATIDLAEGYYLTDNYFATWSLDDLDLDFNDGKISVIFYGLTDTGTDDNYLSVFIFDGLYTKTPLMGWNTLYDASQAFYPAWESVYGATPMGVWSDMNGRALNDVVFTLSNVSMSEYFQDDVFTIAIDPDCRFIFDKIDIQVSPVPEPATMFLFGTGLIGLAGFGRRKFKKKVK